MGKKRIFFGIVSYLIVIVCICMRITVDVEAGVKSRMCRPAPTGARLTTATGTDAGGASMCVCACICVCACGRGAVSAGDAAHLRISSSCAGQASSPTGMVCWGREHLWQRLISHFKSKTNVLPPESQLCASAFSVLLLNEGGRGGGVAGRDYLYH